MQWRIWLFFETVNSPPLMEIPFGLWEQSFFRSWNWKQQKRHRRLLEMHMPHYSHPVDCWMKRGSCEGDLRCPWKKRHIWHLVLSLDAEMCTFKTLKLTKTFGILKQPTSVTHTFETLKSPQWIKAHHQVALVVSLVEGFTTEMGCHGFAGATFAVGRWTWVKVGWLNQKRHPLHRIFVGKLHIITPPTIDMSPPKQGPFQKESCLPTTIFEGTSLFSRGVIVISTCC